MFLRASFLLVLVTLSGCTNSYSITYATSPEGASIICGDQDRGRSPVELHYELDEQNKSDGMLKTRSCKAVWVSGASGWFSNKTDLNEFPNGIIRTLSRKASHDGYEQDARFAMRIQQTQTISNSGINIPIEPENYSGSGNGLIGVQPNLFYNLETGSYTTSPNPHIAPHQDPHILPHVVPHVAPHWEPHNLPHLLPHQH